MPPKTHFSMPLNKTTAAAAPAQWGRWVTWTTESIPLDCVARCAAPSIRHPSAPRTQSGGPSAETVETYPLQFMDPESDESDDESNNIADNDHASDVSLLLSG
jgi:hypothetical protein